MGSSTAVVLSQGGFAPLGDILVMSRTALLVATSVGEEVLLTSRLKRSRNILQCPEQALLKESLALKLRNSAL